MANVTKVYANLYRDSVSLMQLSARLSALAGIEQASAVMATEANIALLKDAGLVVEPPEAGPNDLIVAIAGTKEAFAAALDEMEAALSGTRSRVAAGDEPAPVLPRSLAMAVASHPDINLALISVPGDYAASEALKALNLGLNVMLFSDNVPVADEIALKTRARDRGLIVMGPDCGTAIVDGIPLGFANVVRRGAIGVVAASGTGLQQVTCLVDRAGAGISHALGTGGHDLSADVGGITMMQAISALGADDDTKVIVLISKPPAQEVAERVVAHAVATDKPVVVNFLGADPATLQRPGVTVAATLAEAASMAVALANGKTATEGAPMPPEDPPTPTAGRRYIRGLYSGGTFCYEAQVLLRGAVGPVYSNTPIAPDLALADPWHSREHTVIDLGEDLFTRGRPHPMIDQRLRNARIVQEARDPATAVILFDVVLGFGSHPDPAAEIVAAIHEARDAGSAGPAYVASVCGTAGDPQGLARQEQTLRDAGVLLADSNAAAVRLAASIAARAGG